MFEKIQECYHYNIIPFMSELVALNSIEDTVEGMTIKIEQRLMRLKR